MRYTAAMRYRVTFDDREREVDVQVHPDGRITVELDGKPTDADVVRVPGGINVRIEGRVIDVVIAGTPEESEIAAADKRVIASVHSERELARAARRSGGGPERARAKEIRAPMPGRLVKVLVRPGDDVEARQPVIVIEAMKMENELRAPGAARVAEVVVREGASVEGNAILIRFE